MPSTLSHLYCYCYKLSYPLFLDGTYIHPPYRYIAWNPIAYYPSSSKPL